MIGALKAKDMYDDSAIFFSSDNGGPIYGDGSAGANNYPLKASKKKCPAAPSSAPCGVYYPKTDDHDGARSCARTGEDPRLQSTVRYMAATRG